MFFFRFIYRIIYRAFYILINKNKEAKYASTYLQQLEAKFNGKFDDKTFKKIVFYYSLQVPAIYDAFLFLYDRKSNEHEKERLLQYFICSSIFDNFFDREELTDEEIYNITFNSLTYIPKNFNERVSLYCHLEILNDVRNKESYLKLLLEEYKIQVATRKQFGVELSYEEIEQITLTKGGNAVLMCSYYLDIESSNYELQCWYILGNTIQFTNDLFDIYKDLQKGLKTIPNSITEVNSLKLYYLNIVNNLKENIQLIEVEDHKKLDLKISLMGICALGLVAINNLTQLEIKHNQLPNLKSLSRKELIIDMEKKSNIWLWLKTIYHLSK